MRSSNAIRTGKYAPLRTLYQPIVEIDSKKILGYEALTRGKGKWTSPGNLFRAAYEDGCTAELDFNCFDSAFPIVHRLRKNEFLFVNVEPITLCHCFVHGKEAHFLLKRISHHWGQVVFELTEGMKARDFSLVQRGVLFLRKLGCRFAIDDAAGIGSKLIRLLSLKPDFLKIDISLVKGIQKSRLQQGLVRRLITLGRKSGCLLIAEGVEQKKDVDFIRGMGIPYAQGFYFSRPRKTLLKGPVGPIKTG